MLERPANTRGSHHGALLFYMAYAAIPLSCSLGTCRVLGTVLWSAPLGAMAQWAPGEQERVGSTRNTLWPTDNTNNTDTPQSAFGNVGASLSGDIEPGSLNPLTVRRDRYIGAVQRMSGTPIRRRVCSKVRDCLRSVSMSLHVCARDSAAAHQPCGYAKHTDAATPQLIVLFLGRHTNRNEPAH